MRRLLIALLLLAGCAKREPPRSAEQKAVPHPGLDLNAQSQRNAGLRTVVAQAQTLAPEIEAPGTLQWNAERTWQIGTVATGKVMRVHVAVGDRVKEGDVLAHVHSHDVHDTRAALRSARAERERALASLDYSRRARDRMKRLFELKTVSLQQLENAESDLRNAEASVKKAEADVDKEVQHLTEFLEISADDDGHGKEGAHDDLIPVKSTASGIVIERKVSPGSVVSLGQETFVIADPEQLWMLASFPEASLARLRIGQTAGVSVRAYPGEVFPGRIVRLGEQLDHETRTLQVRIALSAQGRLKPEMYASARVAPTAGLPGVVVPASAVQEMNGRKVVFVQTAPGRFEPRPVEVAQIVAGQAELRSGIAAGDTVVTQGSFLLKSQMAQGAPER